jgi:hypothetical protein
MRPDEFDGFHPNDVNKALESAYNKRSKQDSDYDDDADVDAAELTYRAEIFVLGTNPLSGYGVNLMSYP